MDEKARQEQRLNENDEAQPDRARLAMAFVLAGLAGYTDAVGYLCLANVFSSHMSGNSVAMGAYAGLGRWGTAARRAAPIPLFMVGIAIGAVLTDLQRARRARSAYTLALSIECALLLGLAVFGDHLIVPKGEGAAQDWRFWLAIGAAAIAMGVQNATLRRIAGSSFRTTYISGNLTSMMEAAVEALLERWRGIAKPDEIGREMAKIRLYGGIYLSFVVGALLGGAMQPHFELRAILLSAIMLAVVIGLDWKYKEQPEKTP